MKPSEIIDKALTEVIPDKTKWTQGTRYVRQRYCALGALAMAHHGTPTRQAKNAWTTRVDSLGQPTQILLQGSYLEPEEDLACRAIIDKICEETGHRYSISGYNDYPGRTYDEMRAVMEKARASLQEEGL